MLRAIGKLLAIGLLAEAPASAQSAGKIPVCLSSWSYAQPYVLKRAKSLASQMFEDAGVALEWRSAGSSGCSHRENRAVIIDFAIDSPSTFHPEAMAYAQPYEGVHVVILLDR